MYKLTISGTATTRTPHLAGQTRYLEAGSAELLTDPAYVAELHAWIYSNGVRADYRLERVQPYTPPRRTPAVLDSDQARAILGSSRAKRDELLARAEAAGFSVPDAVSQARTKAGVYAGLMGLLTGGA